MPERPETGAQAALRRALLLAMRPGALLQDQIDCAPLAIEAGLRDVAAALYALSALQLGGAAGDDLIRAAGTELWGDLPAAAHRPAPPKGLPFDLAIAELATLLALGPELAPAQPVAAAEGTVADAGRVSGAVLALAEEVLAGLGTLPSQGVGQAGALLRRLAPPLLALAPVALDQHVGAPLAMLGRLYCLETLRRFAVANGDLLGASSGDGALAARAAALNPAALGPWFSNVRLLIRSARDIGALIDAAAGEAAERSVVETWSVLLSAHLRPYQLTDLVDELGDRGLTGAAQHILARIARAGLIGQFPDTVRRIRDVALDLRAYPLAADAQRLVAESRRADSNEWKILGDIEANAGAGAAAEAHYGRALLLDASNLDARDNMHLVRRGTPPVLKGGYEVAEGRRHLRRARADAFLAARSRS